MSHGTIAGALSRGRHSNRIYLALVAFATALVVGAALGAVTANAAFKATGYSMGVSSTQAAAHPALTFSANIDPLAGDASGDDLSNLRLELPAGMLFNPEAIATPCPTADFNADRCAAPTQVGSIAVSFRAGGKINTATGSVYSITPDSNSVINFGFVVRATTSFQKFFFKSGQATGLTTVRSGLDQDYGLTIEVPNIPRTIRSSWGINTSMTISNITISFNPRANATNSGGYFVFAPTRCDAASSRATMTSYAGASQSFASAYVPTGCDQVTATPGFSINSLNTAAGEPTGINATVTMPTSDQAIQQSHVRDVAVTLPQGTTVNLDVLNALDECSDLYLSYDACPDSSQIGTVAVNVPFLPAPMTGKIYLTGSSPITFGYVLWGARNTYAILRGSAGISNGGVTAKFEMLPQVPWSSANMQFTSTLVNNPDNSCPNATAWANIAGYSGAGAIYGALYSQTNCPPPDTTITSGPEGLTNYRTPSFTFTATPAANATFKCKVDANPWVACTSPFTTATLAEGPHTFNARAFNSEGIGDFTPASRKFTLDTTPPTITITSPTDGQVVTSGDVQLNFTTETDAADYCRLDSGAITSCTSPVNYSNVSDGAHKIRIISRDLAGNLTYLDRNFTVQTAQPPTVTIQTPAPNQAFPTNVATANFAVASPSNTPITKVTCTIVYYQDFGGWVYEYDEDTKTPCASGQRFTIDPEEGRRLRIEAEDANGLVGTALVDFTVGPRPPYSPGIPDNDDVSEGRLTDRTPTIGLYDRDGGRWPNQLWECSLEPKTVTAQWKPCGSPSDIHPYEVTDPLADGEWRFQVRSTSGSIVGTPTTMDFSVGDWDATYAINASTTQAGAHPDIDVDITPNKAGQFRTIDMTLPKGMIGSLNSFPQCPRANVATADCDAATKIGSVVTDVQITGLSSLRPLDGDVFLTEPQVDGDIAGMVINVYSPVSPFADTIIPLRMQLINNAQTMRIFSDSIPTRVGDIYDPEKFTNFWVNDFQMHINGSAGSPYPLLTNPTRCTPAGQFDGTFGDTTGQKSPSRPIAFQPADCASLPFAPTITQTLTSPIAGTLTGVIADIDLPPGNSAMRLARVTEPPSIATNLDAFGRVDDQCPPSTGPLPTSVFDPTDCPEQAVVGTMSVDTPLLPEPLTGKVYLISRTPIPWLGVALRGQGISVGLTGVTSLPNADPDCDPEYEPSGVCQSAVSASFSNLPDLPLSHIRLTLHTNPRTSVDGSTLAGDILSVATPTNPVCLPTGDASSFFVSLGGAPPVSATQALSISGCAPH